MPMALLLMSKPCNEMLLACRLNAEAPAGACTTGLPMPTRLSVFGTVTASMYGPVPGQTSTVSPGLATLTPPWMVVCAGVAAPQLPGAARPSWSTMTVAPNAAAAVSARVATTATGSMAHRMRMRGPPWGGNATNLLPGRLPP